MRAEHGGFRKDVGISQGGWRDSRIHRLGSPGGGRILNFSRSLMGPSEVPGSIGIYIPKVPPTELSVWLPSHHSETIRLVGT